MAACLEPPLAEQLDLFEVPAQQRGEVLSVVLDAVVWVGRPIGRLRGLRCRDEVDAVVPQHAGDVPEVAVMVGEMLDRLERAHSVEAPVGQVELEQVSKAKGDLRAAVPGSSVLDRLRAYVDADDSCCLGCEERAPVTGAACRVEHLNAPAVGKREQVALLVERDDSRRLGVWDDSLGVSHSPHGGSSATGTGRSVTILGVHSIRRLCLAAPLEPVLAGTVFLFACGSSSVPALMRIGGPGRWVALAALAALAVVRAAASGSTGRTNRVWYLSGALVAVGIASAGWSVNPRLTLERVLTLLVLFAAGTALAIGPPDPAGAATRVLHGVLAGAALVALASLLLIAASHDEAVQAATGGSGERFQGLGQNPNTVPMLLAVGLPIAVWVALSPSVHRRLIGLGLVLLFAGEIAASGSRGPIYAGFGGALLCAAVGTRTAAMKAAVCVGLVALAVGCVFVPRLEKAAASSVSRASPATTVTGTTAAARGIDAQQVLRLDDEIGRPPLGAYRPSVPRTLFGSSGRAQAWDGALNQGGSRPLLGYGFGTEDRVFTDRFYTFEGNLPENSYIGTFLQLGALGALLLVGLLVALAWSALRLLISASAARSGPGGAAAGVLAAAVLVGMTQSGLVSVGNIAASSIWLCALTLPALALNAGRS